MERLKQEKRMIVTIKTIICAILIGIIFNKLKLDIPCPPTIEGILGIIGLFIGYKLGAML